LNEIKEVLVVFSGRVQGVGFRWQTQRCLEDLALKGYVRNLRDGRVELRLQGAQELVEEAIARVERRMAAYISDTSVSNQDLSADLPSFSIAY